MRYFIRRERKANFRTPNETHTSGICNARNAITRINSGFITITAFNKNECWIKPDFNMRQSLSRANLKI